MLSWFSRGWSRHAKNDAASCQRFSDANCAKAQTGDRPPDAHPMSIRCLHLRRRCPLLQSRSRPLHHCHTLGDPSFRQPSRVRIVPVDLGYCATTPAFDRPSYRTAARHHGWRRAWREDCVEGQPPCRTDQSCSAILQIRSYSSWCINVVLRMLRIGLGGKGKKLT
jgi:hypothetical protein